MAFTQLPSFTQTVSMLPDNPALTPAQLKAQFDAAPTQLLTYFNNLITALKQTTSGDSGAKNVGVTTVGSMVGNDVQTLLGLLDSRVAKQEIGTSQTELATGAYYMTDTQTITPTKKLSECPNGWLLIWSDYVSGTGTNDFDFFTIAVPKYYGSHFNGKAHLYAIPTSESATTMTLAPKKLYIYDDKIIGHADNSVSGNNSNNVVLRAVLSW